jgi:hypothetical protein
MKPDLYPDLSQRYLIFGRCGSNALPMDGRAALPPHPNVRDNSTDFRNLESNHLADVGLVPR